MLFIYFLFVSFTLARERDVWSVGNVELKPEAKPEPSVTFGFWRKLHPDCAKSKINENGCTIPEDQRISNKTCTGNISTASNDWQVCHGVKGLGRGSVRWRLKKDTYKYTKTTNTKLTIEVARKEEIRE